MTITATGRRTPATRKKRRLQVVIAGMIMLGVAVFLVLSAFRDNILFFYSPTDILQKSVKSGQSIRLGGVVAEGSVKKGANGAISFDVTDFKHDIVVRYTGLLPDLFREGQGVVTEGWMETDGSFHATSVLAKYDEKYMPKEVADALKRSGEWKGDSAPVGPEK